MFPMRYELKFINYLEEIQSIIGELKVLQSECGIIKISFS